MPYSVDTSALLEAWVRRYPPDVFPSVWERIDAALTAGVLIVIEEVLYELEKKDDEVYRWTKDRAGLLISTDEAIQVQVAAILARHPRLVDTRKERSGGDPFVIALARIKGCIVVTAEPPTGKLEKPNIPDVCSAIGVRCVNLVEMFRELGWRV